MKISESDRNEIIAIQFDDEIMFGKSAIDKAVELQSFTAIHSRAVFKFMACMDLGPQWEEFAEYPTLFTMSEYREFMENGK